jgi:hypothetical protein
VLLELFDEGLDVAAGGALVVAVFDEGPGGVGLALGVVCGGDGGGEFGHGWLDAVGVVGASGCA